MDSGVCVVILPVVTWVTERAGPHRVKPFAHRWAGTRTADLETLARRRECFIAFAAGVQRGAGDAKLAAWIQAVTDNRGLWSREWECAWMIEHYHSRFARNGFMTMRPALESLAPADALAMAIRFLDETLPRATLCVAPYVAAL